tara:strand:+ start:2004 stop:2228 length:225 start_codon:yes stop_codon:yes gene_type:complete
MKTIMSKKDVKEILLVLEDKINTYKHEMKGAGFSEFKMYRNLIADLMMLQDKIVRTQNEYIDLKTEVEKAKQYN